MFYNYYPNRKDHRSVYYDSRRFDASCRNHHSCPYCYNTRTYQRRRAFEAARIELRAYREGLLDSNEREEAYNDQQYDIVLDNLLISIANGEMRY